MDDNLIAIAASDLTPLRAALEGLIRDACAVLASDDMLFMVRQAPWVQVRRHLGPAGSSVALETVFRPEAILTTPAERRVMALGANESVIEQLHALPSWRDLLPPPNDRPADFDERTYLQKVLVVGFLKRYLSVSHKAEYDASLFDDAFAVLERILIDRSLVERLLIPLAGLTWGSGVEVLSLDETTRLRRLTDADLESLLNANRDPTLGSGAEMRPFLWVQAGIDAEWRVPLHGARLGAQRFEAAFDALTALRLAAPGLISAPTGHGTTPFLGWLGTVNTSQPLPFRANTSAAPYNLTEELVALVKEIFSALRNLSSVDRETVGLALERFHRSFDTPRPEERVVDLIIALESLLGDRGSGIAFKLGVRLPLYVATERADRARLRDLVRHSYGMRSAIVHGGRVRPHATLDLQPVLTQLEEATRRVLRRAIMDAGSGTRSVASISRYIDDELVLGGK